MYRSITALFLVLTSMSSWGQPSVGFDLTGVTFTTGSTVSLTLVGSNFTNGLLGGGVDLQFNSAVMNLESVSVISTVFDQTPGNGFIPPVVITNTGGPDSTATGVDFAAFLNSTPVGTFDIATFQFLVEGSAGSSSNLTLSADCCGFAFTDGSGTTLTAITDFSIGTQSILVSPAIVTPVPEIDPTSVMSALTLLLGSLAVLRGRGAGRIVARRF